MSASKHLLQFKMSLMMSSGNLLSLYQVHELQFVRLQGKGQVQFSVIPNENDGKNEKR